MALLSSYFLKIPQLQTGSSIIFVSDHKPLKVLEPSEKAFDFPTSFISPKWPTIMRYGGSVSF